MDQIEALDWAVYNHFAYQLSGDRRLQKFMEVANDASGYVGTCFLLLVAIGFFLLQRHWWSALVAVLSFAAANGLTLAFQCIVPRERPNKAIAWVGAEHMAGSYPALSVFLFMLDMILIAFAVWGLTPRLWQRGSYVLVATALTVWVSMSQFVLPIHFLTDTFGGMAGAALVGWTAYQFLDRSPPVAAEPAGPATDS